MTTTKSASLFPPGKIVATRGALALGISFLPFLRRHLRGDWGGVCEEDAQANRDAVELGLRILSSYTTPNDEKFWIITEADRSATTILLPEEY